MNYEYGMLMTGASNISINGNNLTNINYGVAFGTNTYSVNVTNNQFLSDSNNFYAISTGLATYYNIIGNRILFHLLNILIYLFQIF